MKESRLYSFINNKSGFTLHFLEGSKLLNTIGEIHNIGDNARPYYAKTILTTQQMITFLKAGESLGVYVDSEEPYFRFKIETNFTGSMRTLLLPEEFQSFPDEITGKARITKIFSNTNPYTSNIELEKEKPDEIINKILKESYQTNSKVITSTNLEQSIMITKLPRVDVKRVVADDDDIPMDEFILRHNVFIEELFGKNLREIQDIVEFVEQYDFDYLHSKEVKFECPCSEERMATNLLNISGNDIDDLFAGDEKLETRCDYCNTTYIFTKDSLSLKS
jgi:molecular chaperone Hsp33